MASLRMQTQLFILPDAEAEDNLMIFRVIQLLNAEYLPVTSANA